jgi:hypothetical protein
MGVNSHGAPIPTSGRVVRVVVFNADGVKVRRAGLVCQCLDKEDLRIDVHVFTKPGDRLADTGRNLPGPVELLEDVRPWPDDPAAPEKTWHWHPRD